MLERKDTTSNRPLPHQPNAARVTATGNRWTVWAERLIQRQRRNALRLGTSFVFAEPPAPVFERVEHWHQASLTVRPQLRLAMPALLQQVLRRETHQTFARQTREIQFHTLPPTQTNVTYWRVHTNRQQVTDDAPVAASGTSNQRNVRTSLPPLTRVFVRAQTGETAETSTVARVRQETVLLERRGLNVQWLMEARKRMEEQQHRTLVTREEGRSVRSAESLAREEGVFEPKHRPSNAINGTPAFAQTPMDIERITDQVVRSLDQRLVAHRERLGKVF